MPEETNALVAVTANLPAEIADGVTRLIQRMDPNKPGFEEMGGARFRPPVVKIHQATTGESPDNSNLGDIFTDAGDVLEVPFRFVPLYMYYTHARFRIGEVMPSCSSEDAKTSKSGTLCAECDDRPFKGGERTDCNKSINVIAVNETFDRIFHLQFSKTSYRAGSTLFRQASASMVPWEKIYSLGTDERKRNEGQGKYWVFKVSASGDAVSRDLHAVAEYLHGEIARGRKAYLQALRERASEAQSVVDSIGADIGEDAGANASSSDSNFEDL